MPTVHVNGIDLYHEVSGNGDPVVFAHGAGGNHASWWQQVADFSNTYQVITFDHRGFGHSKDIHNGPGINAFADDLEALLEYLGIDQTFLVAQSMGGWTSLGFTVRHPNRVRALVMADTPGGIDDPSVHEIAREVAKTNQGKSLLERALPQSFRDRCPEKTELYTAIYGFNFPTPDTSGLRGTKVATAAQLKSLKVPILYLVGQEDISTPPNLIEAAHRLTPSSSYLEVPGAGHSVYFEKPEVFNYLVHQFLENLDIQ
ncbi:alpha/beta hydrolase [SAR202 cluster bacterium AD-804-J14_MRT_500m]|nr:alpha/beta hydrolase [SAR202 cluster bacterium AD-804-J14_MRT_500m]